MSLRNFVKSQRTFWRKKSAKCPLFVRKKSAGAPQGPSIGERARTSGTVQRTFWGFQRTKSGQKADKKILYLCGLRTKRTFFSIEINSKQKTPKLIKKYKYIAKNVRFVRWTSIA